MVYGSLSTLVELSGGHLERRALRGIQETGGVLGTGRANAVDHERCDDYGCGDYGCYNGTALRPSSANSRTLTCDRFAHVYD
ncbi:hypothetical protein AAVH_19145 [Aphelenchoides avenae]|nr:hypothetical protein AAVH_19145 [Aphelenchus avenae]